MRYLKLIHVLTCAAAFAACGEKPEVEPRVDETHYVTFTAPAVTMSGVEVGADGLSRAKLLNAFPEGEAFRVYGYCVPKQVNNTSEDWQAASSPWDTKSGFVRADVFYATDVKCGGGDASYGNNLKEWYVDEVGDVPAGANAANFRYSFIAHYPVSGFTVNRASASVAGVPIFTFTMPWNGENTSLDHVLVPDAMLAEKFDHRRAEGAVGLRFYHILTGLRFRVNNYSNEELVIESVTMSGQFYREATFDYTKNVVKQATKSLSQSSYSGVFTLTNGAQSCPAGAASPYLGATVENPDGTTILLLPNLEADPSTADRPENPIYSLGDKKTITIRYHYGNGTGRTAVIENFHLSYKPGQSTRYTGNLNFVGDRFVLVFQADTDQWEDGSDNGIIIN